MEVKEIAAIMLKEVFGRLNEQGITLEVTERFKDRYGRGLQPQLRSGITSGNYALVGR